MSGVWWSDEALAELELVVEDPAVREQLKRNAEETLHDIPPGANSADEGAEGEIMWRRAITHEQERQIKAGTLLEPEDDPYQAWNYILFYRKREPDHGFEVLAVRSVHQIASLLMKMGLGHAEADADVAG
jgi:hypothetical protein